MLDHWYFTCCIHGTPDASAAFLSILDVLRRADDERVVTTALEELGQAEALMQIYAVGPVVEAAQRCESDAVRHLASARIAAVLDHVPASAELLGRLADAAVWQPPQADIVELAEHAAEAVLRQAREPGEPQPYLDLQERVAETTLLSLVRILYRTHRELDRVLSQRGDEEPDTVGFRAMGTFLENASTGAYGRLAQLLAVRMLATSQEPRALLVRVRRTPGAELDVEPDILALAAELSLIPATRSLSDGDRLSALDSIRAEATELRHLRRLLDETGEGRGRPAGRGGSRPLTDMGLKSDPDHRVAVTGVLWHAALWQLATRLDPEGCSGWLAGTWRETQRSLGRYRRDQPNAMTTRYVGQRHGDRDNKGWLDLLRSFLAVRQDSQVELRYSPDYDKISEYFESTTLPHLFSPWLAIGVNRSNNEDYYPTAREPVAMLRLILAAALGIEILETTDRCCPGRASVLRTVAHAARVLSRFSHWLRHYPNPDKIGPGDLRLPLPVTSLALFASWRVADVGCGRSARVDPAEFAELLGNDQNPAGAQLALAWTLTTWIADGLAAAHDPDLAGRWLPLIPDVCWVKDKKGPWPDRTRAALNMRYAIPGDPPDLSSFQWRATTPEEDGGQGAPDIARVDGRRLLLSSARPWRDWELAADTSSWQWHKQVILAIQRVGDLPDPEDQPEAPTTQWVDDLRSMLCSANVKVDLDRFARLRLIELLDAPAVAADHDMQLLIMRVIIEFGTPYDWSRLFDYVIDQPAVSAATPGQAAQRLWLDYGRLLATALEHDGHADLDRSQPRDPREVDGERRKLDLIRDQLSAYLYTVGELADPEQVARVRQEISDLRTRRLSQARSAMERVRAIPDILSDGRPVLSVPAGQAFLRTWALRAVLRNPVNEVRDVHFQAFAAGRQAFLFDPRGTDELTVTDSSGVAGTSCIGFVLAEVAGAEPRYRVNFGTGSPVLVPASRESAFSPGDAVTARLTRDAASGTVSASGPLRSLAAQENASGPVVAEVTERRSTDNVLSVRVPGRGIDARSVDLAVWDPDISRSFASLPPRTVKVLASSTEASSLVPVLGDFPELLIREEDAARQPLVLAFCGYDGDGLSDAVWRFSSAPGITYDLPVAIFETADAAALDTELRLHDDPGGLLVTVQADRICSKVRLRLIRGEVSDPVHPELQTPFDRRNLLWRDRFVGDDSQIATRDADGRWTISAAGPDGSALPGFPGQLSIRWQGRPPARTEQRTEVAITSWEPGDQRLAKVRAQAMQVYSLNWQDDPAGVLDRVLGLGKGSLLTLASAIQATSDAAGNVRCRTTDGLVVTVAAESLTMAKLDNDCSLDSLAAGRVAEVTPSMPWSEQKVARVRPDTLPGIIRELGTVEGILTQVPRPVEEHATAHQVLFRADGETRDAWIDLTDRAVIRPVSPGDKITVMVDEYGGARAIISSFRGFARALWSLETSTAPVENAYYLGEVRLRGTARPLCQSPQPGVLLEWPEYAADASHLARWCADEFRGGLPGTWTAWNESRAVSRVKLKADGDRSWYLCGRTTSGGGTGRREVQGAPSLRIVRRGDHYALERDFWIRTSAAQARAQNRPESGAEREAVLERLADLPAVQVVVQDQSPAKVLLPELLSEGVSRTACRVTVAADSQPYVADAPYGEEGRGRLHREDTEFVVTFRDVQPLRPEQYREHLGAPTDEDVRAESLCYVGPRVIDEDGDEQPGHLFEFGYGWTLLVSEDRLRFRGRPFKDARVLLFHGDMVTHVRFLEQQARDMPTLVMDVSGVLIRSQATSLYLQAKDHGLVHTIHARARGSQLQVDSIEGFDEERLRDWASYRPSRARIDPDSVPMLTARTGGRDERLTFYGRLDTKLFEETTGQELMFRHVKLTLDRNEGMAALFHREVVFLRGGLLTTTRNDTLLRLHALRGFDSADVGRDVGSAVNLSRRHFSVQESLLRRAAMAGKTDSYKDTIFPVRLELSERGAVVASLRTVPPRPLKALRDVIRSTGDAQYAAVDGKKAPTTKGGMDTDDAAPPALRVEVRPGVVFELPEDRVVTVPSNLDEGAIVRLDLEDETNRFVVVPCTYSTRRYVGDQGRLVVALPMDGLLRLSLRDEQAVGTDSWWVKSPAARFTVGGLPTVVARPAAYLHDESQWVGPRARGLRGLMAKRHPKVAWLGWQQSRGWTLAPNVGASIYGTLQIEAHRVALRLPTGDTGQVLHWHRLSFMDSPIDAILARARKRTWRYHDQVTGWWQNDEVVVASLIPQALEEASDQSATAGVLCFAPDRDGPRLRYTGTELPRYGFPVSHLVESATQVTESYAVADVSLDDGRPAGVWLELAPGQVTEVVGELMTWTSGAVSVSLGQLAWQHFAPGDEIMLQATPQELSTVDKIELRGWRRGPRAAFGPRRVLLPVLRHNQGEEALRLGAGAFSLAYPAAEPLAADAAWLAPDNELTPDSRPSLRRGDTVLIGCGPRGRLVVLGAERYEARPERRREHVWDEDPLREALFGQDGKGPHSHLIREVVIAAGGAVPATVEGVFEGPEGAAVYFSLRDQRAEIEPGQLAIAQPLGLLGNRYLLLRLGRGLIRLPMRDVVSGAPDEAFPALATALAESGTWIWVHRAADDHFRTGMATRRSRDGRFQAELAIGSETDGTVPTGLLARSAKTQRLHWCPADQLAHTRLSLTEIRALWITDQPPHMRRSFRAVLIGESRSGRYLSLVHSSEAMAEVKRLQPGSQLRVTIRAKATGWEAGQAEWDMYLVESCATKISMRCRVRSGTQVRLGDLLHVEVDEHHPAQPRSITVVRVGDRRYRIDLPPWMLADRPAPQQRRAAFSDFLRWRAQADEPVPDPAELTEPADGPALLRSLCLAYQASLANGASPVGSQVALRWLRAEDESLEVDLPYPLMALATLAAACRQGRQPLMEQATALGAEEAAGLLRTYRRELRTGMARLARRAVRSIHVEALIRRWFQGRPGDSSQTWQRISRLEGKLSPALTEADMSEILQFAYAAELAGDWEGLRIADGLKATIGRLEGIEQICADAPILMKVVALRQMDIPDFTARRMSSRGFSAAEFQLDHLREIIEHITLEGIDITLLSAIPAFDFARD